MNKKAALHKDRATVDIEQRKLIAAIFPQTTKSAPSPAENFIDIDKRGLKNLPEQLTTNSSAGVGD